MADLSLTAASVAKGTGSTTQDGTAGETITAGQPLYIKSSDGKLYKADSDTGTPAEAACVGIALHASLASQPLKYLNSGPITIGATVTQGEVYCVSNTAGGVCPLSDIGAADYTTIIGIATSTTQITVNINAGGVAHG